MNNNVFSYGMEATTCFILLQEFRLLCHGVVGASFFPLRKKEWLVLHATRNVVPSKVTIYIARPSKERTGRGHVQLIYQMPERFPLPMMAWLYLLLVVIKVHWKSYLIWWSGVPSKSHHDTTDQFSFLISVLVHNKWKTPNCSYASWVLCLFCLYQKSSFFLLTFSSEMFTKIIYM